MRFLVESGTHEIDNVGDVAMLQAVVGRLRGRFAGCEIAVVTARPDRLAIALPDVEPVAASNWHDLRATPIPRRFEYARLSRKIRWREKLLATRLPRLARLGKLRDPAATPAQREAAAALYDAVARADAVVAAGGGYVNDQFKGHALSVLATLGLAQGLGKPTAMFGIGLESLADPELLYVAKSVMPRLDVLTLREDADGPVLCRQLGVPDDRVVVTGDDALVVSAATPPGERRHLGVNLRITDDNLVTRDAVAAVREAIADVCASRDATPTPVVVRTSDSPGSDVDAAARLIDDVALLDAARAVRTPADAMARIAACRVVVTGAYHNAVFALSMGVPVVGLYKNDYYRSKLGGVARQFGVGMTTLSLADADLKNRLVDAARSLWDAADDLGPALRAAAARQVASADAAYERFFESLGARR